MASSCMTIHPNHGTKMLEDGQTCKTLSVPAAGRLYYGLSRNASYSATKRGDIPVIRVGRVLRVPVTAMERLLESAATKTLEGSR